MFDITDVTVTLADGYSFDATLNGNNFLVKGSVSDDELVDTNLTSIKVTDASNKDNVILTYKNATCCNNFKNESPQRLVFREFSAEELRYKDLTSKLEFLAVMTDNDIS